MHITFLENKPNFARSGPKWVFDIDTLTKSMNYKPVVAGNQSNGNAGTKACDDAGEEEKKDAENSENKDSEVPSIEEPRVNQEKDANINSTNNINTVSPTVNAASMKDSAVDENIVYGCADDLNMPNLEEIVYSDDVEIGNRGEQNTKDFQNCLWLVFYPKRNDSALTDPSWIEAMQDELLQFKLQKIEEEVYVCQPPGFEDPKFPDRVYKVMQKEDGIFISQDKYVDEILKKFGFSTVKTASTPMETSKPLMKDENAEDVDVHLYRSMIGSLMYLTSSRPDIMFVVCACARFQVTPKVSHLHAVKRIFRYLKGQPKLGLWYPKDSPFDLEAYTDSDYAGASLDRKSTTGGCQFLGSRLISWQCKKQTVVANSTTEAEYVAASNCCGQVLWIQNQMLDYGYNFMNTKIFHDMRPSA
ncbi:hypothetical protein Tco_1315996 [Tanacetum coccineum]